MKKLKDKPFVEMDDLESERAWAGINKSVYEAMLKDARSGATEKHSLTLVVLTTADGAKRIVDWAADYGDDEAIGNDAEMIRRIRRLGLLQPGESLEHFTTEIDLTANRWVPVL